MKSLLPYKKYKYRAVELYFFIKRIINYEINLLYLIREIMESFDYFPENINILIVDKKYKNYDNIVIPPTVFVIGPNVFNECHKLKKINIPDSIENIGNGAFSRCSNLKEIVIPSSVREIGYRTFYMCQNLEKFYIKEKNLLTFLNYSKGLKTIEYEAFANCSNLKYFILSKSVENISFRAFANCSNLKYINTTNIKNIDNYAFNNCKSLNSILLKKNITLGYHSLPDSVKINYLNIF